MLLVNNNNINNFYATAINPVPSLYPNLFK